MGFHPTPELVVVNPVQRITQKVTRARLLNQDSRRDGACAWMELSLQPEKTRAVEYQVSGSRAVEVSYVVLPVIGSSGVGHHDD
jgi:hypothetical protein